MNKILCFIGLVILNLSAFADDKIISYEQMPVEARALIELAIMYNDNGEYDDAVHVYDGLIKDYPDVVDIKYEKGYSLYCAKRYAEVDELCSDIVKSGKANPLIYCLWGNAFDDSGDPNRALDVYREGLKHYPDFAQLYFEGGMTYFRYEYTDEAIKWINKAIKVDPNHGSSYYRGAQLYADTKDKAWALIYAETNILLVPQNNDRVIEMSKLIAKILDENIVFAGDTTSVRLASDIRLNVVKEGADRTEANVFLGFPGVYEQCVGMALNGIETYGEPYFEAKSIRSIAELRRAVLDVYFKGTENLFGDSMYLFEFQKSVVEAGHWDAYNYWLLSGAFPEESDAYFKANSDAFNAFVAWYNRAPFCLGDGRTVGAMNITDHERPMTMMQALGFCADLLRRITNVAE